MLEHRLSVIVEGSPDAFLQRYAWPIERQHLCVVTASVTHPHGGVQVMAYLRCVSGLFAYHPAQIIERHRYARPEIDWSCDILCYGFSHRIHHVDDVYEVANLCAISPHVEWIRSPTGSIYVARERVCQVLVSAIATERSECHNSGVGRIYELQTVFTREFGPAIGHIWVVHVVEVDIGFSQSICRLLQPDWIGRGGREVNQSTRPTTDGPLAQFCVDRKIRCNCQGLTLDGGPATHDGRKMYHKIVMSIICLEKFTLIILKI